MYIVVDKKTKEVIHVNPAPLDQMLGDKDVYFKFDSSSMEVVRSGRSVLPERFEVRGGELVDLSASAKGSPASAEMSDAERVAEGSIKLARDEKLEGEKIVKKSIGEQIKEGLISVADVKKERIRQFSIMALQLRAAILPDYKLQNAALGIYDVAVVASIRATVEAFRNEFYRLERMVNEAKDLNGIDAIKDNFPKALITLGTHASDKPKSPGKKR